jgi:hypothetical protein
MFKKSSLTESKSGRNRCGPGLTRSSSSISCHGMEFPVEAIPPSAQMLQLISDGPQGEAGQETYRKCRWVDSPCIQSWSLKTPSRFHAFKKKTPAEFWPSRGVRLYVKTLPSLIGRDTFNLTLASAIASISAKPMSLTSTALETFLGVAVHGWTDRDCCFPFKRKGGSRFGK